MFLEKIKRGFKIFMLCISSQQVYNKCYNECRNNLSKNDFHEEYEHCAHEIKTSRIKIKATTLASQQGWLGCAKHHLFFCSF